MKNQKIFNALALSLLFCSPLSFGYFSGEYSPRGLDTPRSTAPSSTAELQEDTMITSESDVIYALITEDEERRFKLRQKHFDEEQLAFGEVLTEVARLIDPIFKVSAVPGGISRLLDAAQALKKLTLIHTTQELGSESKRSKLKKLAEITQRRTDNLNRSDPEVLFPAENWDSRADHFLEGMGVLHGSGSPVQLYMHRVLAQARLIHLRSQKGSRLKGMMPTRLLNSWNSWTNGTRSKFSKKRTFQMLSLLSELGVTPESGKLADEDWYGF